LPDISANDVAHPEIQFIDQLSRGPVYDRI
jgi:hypothetical protein